MAAGRGARRPAALGTVLALTVDVPDVDVVRAWVDGAGAAGWTALVLGLAVVLLPGPALGGVGARRAGGRLRAGARRGVRRGLLAALAAFGLSRPSAALRPPACRSAARPGRRPDGPPGLRRRPDRAAAADDAVRRPQLRRGLTAIRWPPYVAGTALGLVPSTVVQVAIGASAGAVVDRATLTDRRPAAGRRRAPVARRRCLAPPATRWRRLTAPEEPAQHPAGAPWCGPRAAGSGRRGCRAPSARSARAGAAPTSRSFSRRVAAAGTGLTRPEAAQQQLSRRLGRPGGPSSGHPAHCPAVAVGGERPAAVRHVARVTPPVMSHEAASAPVTSTRAAIPTRAPRGRQGRAAGHDPARARRARRPVPGRR